MKFKKIGLLVIAGLLVIGIICGAGAAAQTNQGTTIHTFDKTYNSNSISYIDAITETAGYLFYTGQKAISTLSGGVLEPVTDVIDQQIRYACNYLNPVDSTSTKDFEETSAEYEETADDNYAKVSYFNLTDETLANKEAGQFTTYENGAAAPGLANETQKYNSSVTILKNESSVAEPEEITLDVSDESARITKTYTKNTNHEKIETEQVENQMTETENAVNAETKDSFGISSIHFNVDDSTELKTTDLDSSAKRTMAKK